MKPATPTEVSNYSRLLSRPNRTCRTSDRTAPRRPRGTNQSELLAALADPQLIKDAVAITGNGELPMLRRRSDSVRWINDRLEITTANNAVVTIKLTAPENFKNDAIEFVDYITLRALAHVTVKIGRQTRAWTKRLESERAALQSRIKITTAQLKSATNANDATAIEATLQSQRESLTDLLKDIDFSRSADDQASHLQLVQMATAIDTNP